MVILHIITSSGDWTGTEQYAFGLSKGMRERGHRMVFAINNDLAVHKDGDTVYRRFESLGKIYLLPLKSLFGLRAIGGLRKIIGKEKPDIIHTHQPKNILRAWLAKNKKTPIVHTLHFITGSSSPRLLYRWIYSRASRIISVSAPAKNRILEIYPGLDASRIVPVFNNAAPARMEKLQNPEPENPVSFRPAAGSGAPVPVLAYAGRLTPEKGLEILLEAGRLLKKENRTFLLKIAGAGNDDYVNRLKTKAKEYDLENTVVFEAFPARTGPFIAGIDIGIFPAPIPQAGSITVREFMSAGKVVVAADNGGPEEYPENGVTGLLVPAAEPERLREALAKLLDDPLLRETIGKNARIKLERELSFDQFIERIYRVYYQCLPS